LGRLGDTGGDLDILGDTWIYWGRLWIFMRRQGETWIYMGDKGLMGIHGESKRYFGRPEDFIEVTWNTWR
jgi:hypothetical protein